MKNQREVLEIDRLWKNLPSDFRGWIKAKYDVVKLSFNDLRKIVDTYGKRFGYIESRKLESDETFKCPKCGSKVLKKTGYCLKCKKKVKESKKLENKNTDSIIRQIELSENYIKFYKTKTENVGDFNYWTNYKDYLEKFLKGDILEKQVVHDARFSEDKGMSGAASWIQREFLINITGSVSYLESKKIKEEYENESLEKSIISFFVHNPYPSDDMVHQFAKDIGVEKDVMETKIYELVSTIICGGKSYEKKDHIFPEIQLLKGIEVEYEHVDKNSPFAKCLAKKIAKDHIVESDEYYIPFLKNMEEEMPKNYKDEVKENKFIDVNESEINEILKSKNENDENITKAVLMILKNIGKGMKSRRAFIDAVVEYDYYGKDKIKQRMMIADILRNKYDVFIEKPELGFTESKIKKYLDEQKKLKLEDVIDTIDVGYVSKTDSLKIKDYIKKNKGKKAGNTKYKIGQIVYVPGDYSVNDPGSGGMIVKGYKDSLVVFDDKFNYLDELTERSAVLYDPNEKWYYDESIDIKTEARIDDAIIDFYLHSIQKNRNSPQQALKITSDRFDMSEMDIRKILLKNNINLESTEITTSTIVLGNNVNEETNTTVYDTGLEKENIKEEVLNDLLKEIKNVEIKKENKIDESLLNKLLEKIGDVQVKEENGKYTIVEEKTEKTQELKTVINENKDIGLNIVKELLEVKLKEKQLKLAKKLLDEKEDEDI